jgi:flagellar hook-basal body complex protein FliE
VSVDGLKASQAYQAVARLAAAAPRVTEGSEPARADFGALVKAAVSDAATTLKAGEQAAASVAAGQAGLVDVVTAVSAAEVTLETAIAIRNKVVEAYQEIMRMPI